MDKLVINIQDEFGKEYQFHTAVFEYKIEGNFKKHAVGYSDIDKIIITEKVTGNMHQTYHNVKSLYISRIESEVSNA